MNESKYTIITCEKPSVAQEFANTLIKDKTRRDGYVFGYSDILQKNVCITWTYGHLLTIAYPEKYNEELKEWRLDTLPFLPQRYRYDVIEEAKKQFKIIKLLYNNKNPEICADTWLSAGDAGREGLYIQCLVRDSAGMDPNITEKVVWIDSYTDSEIIRGINEAKPITHYDKKKAAAYMRAIEDYAVGINFSRALTIKFGDTYRNKANLQKGAIAVGRVMSCVLAMIVEKEREIKNFKETFFYGVTADIDNIKAHWKVTPESKFFESPLLYNETGFIDKENAEKLISNLNTDKKLIVSNAKITEETKKAPLLFNLAELQNFCSAKYKISPNDTLDVAQSLYEKKLITYPRTDARVLSTAMADKIRENLNGLIKLNYKTDKLRVIASNGWYKNLINTQYVDDKQITDHYAIIPTGITGAINTLNDIQSQIYFDIVDRFMCIFYPPAKFVKVDTEFKHSTNEKFFIGAKTLKELGYIEILKEDEKIIDNPLLAYKQGMSVNCNFSLSTGKTTPPKRYTSGSMIIAMENAGKLIEDEELRTQIKGSGIGTSATRAAIIEKLVKTKQIDLNKKTQILTPLVAGECTYDIIKDAIPEFLRPEMTASWEKGLEQIETGNITAEDYRKKLEDYVTKEVNKIKAKESSGMTSYTSSKSNQVSLSSITCPICKKGHITETSKGFGCSEYKNGCPFVIWKKYKGVNLTASDIYKVFTKGHTSVLKGFTSSKGTSFSARLKWDAESNMLKYDFPKKDE